MKLDVQSVEKIQQKALPFNEQAINHLIEKIGDAQIVLLGEATHGTHEFYEIRSQISKKLIEEKGFNVIAIEGDWPDAYQINRYIHHQEYTTAQKALASFDRFPSWMWKNVPLVSLLEWLKKHNETSKNNVSFYGLDLYSLFRSIDAVIAYLEKIDPTIAAQAKKSYSCFDQFSHDPQLYGHAIFAQLAPSCKNEVIAQLKKLEEYEWRLVTEKKTTSEDAFYITQNARVIKNSEAYYRSMFINEVSNWNLRDTHMMQTLEEIRTYIKGSNRIPKIIVWAHNSHIGNSAATQMSKNGEFNIGHLVKEKYGTDSYTIGFTTYEGTVSAASDWHEPVERKIVRRALPESYEYLFHHVKIPNFLLTFEDKEIVPKKMLERAIGVVYAPQTERVSHYFSAFLAHQFDAVIHIDRTTALEPLEKTSRWIEGEVPEMYPSGY